ncbi:MAG: hypothetical protein HYZ23_00550 [Chloroflexi bacterium]|nr:hypothetical protein [Chloroflexota bacterium]
MQRLFPAILLLLTLLPASCAPQPDPVAEPIAAISSPTSSPHPREIRFALIGAPRDVNAWELFDESGADYAAYAVRNEYWPRLYHLIPPERTFAPLAADGMPSEISQQGDFYTATVALRADLTWTDGSPLTAEDVAFTVNTSLAFELGHDWGAYYPREYLDHAEAANDSAVRYYFKRKPNVEVWQYGTLQGPILQKDFWESAVENAASLLPDDSLRNDIEETRARLATVKRDLADLEAKVLAIKLSGKQNRILDSDLKRMQGEFVYVQSVLDSLLEEYDTRLGSAQEELYGANDQGEPLLGTWLPAAEENGALVNRVNPDFPFLRPSFERVIYQTYSNNADAMGAFQNGGVDFILSPGHDPSPVEGAMYFPTYNARFLAFSPSNTFLADPAFRAALDCMIDRDRLAGDTLQGRAAPLDHFVLSYQWHDPAVQSPCAGFDASSRIGRAGQILTDAGYSWTHEPNAEHAGQGLMVNGRAFPTVTLLAPFEEQEPMRNRAAYHIAERAQYVGLNVTVREMSVDDILYRVFSSQKYDMALIGWRLSEYPAYLCEWVAGGNAYFTTGNSGKSALGTGTGLRSGCDALEGESDLGEASRIILQVESIMVSEWPLLPLFMEIQADVYRNISYPAGNVLSGWVGLYGAPSYLAPLP